MHNRMTWTVAALASALLIALMAWASAPQQAGDSGFAKNAAEAGLAEVELGKIAAQKASRSDVRQFAQNMVNEHEQASKELKALAQKKNIGLSNQLDASHNDERQKLQTLSGAEFDKTYMQIMVFEHRQALHQFEQESKSGSDPDFRGYAGRQLSSIHSHLNAAETMLKQLGGNPEASKP